MPPIRLSVLGVGLLGGSLGLAAKKYANSCRVVGYAHRASTLEAALETGAIDEGYSDPADAVRGADLVVLCTPVGMLSSLLAHIAPALAPYAVVTDVGSTKQSLTAAADQLILNGRFIGSHPMAGSEKRGVAFAQADLFMNAVCITTPTSRTDPEALSAVEALWSTVGMHIRRLSPADHDRLVGDVSHLPHAVAAALVALQSPESLELRGNGFLDATRIAAGDGGLWRDILLDNRQNVSVAIDRLKGSLTHLQELLDGDRHEELKAWLDRAAERREGLQSRRDDEANRNV